MRIPIQPVPYQGSKRAIAHQIMKFAPSKIERLIEPFAGSAAISLYAAHNKIAKSFLINDSYEPLVDLWNKIIENPEKCSQEYEKIWHGQLETPTEYYFKIRKEFNEDHDPIKFLYLMVRCAKNAIRFNLKGEFNQSPDRRRLGRRPDAMRKHIILSSLLLCKKIEVKNLDYEDILKKATRKDLIYMDPPYLGTSGARDSRYHQGLDIIRFIRNLEDLNKRKIPFILSFDGQHGEKKYGPPLPSHLELKHIPIHAGRSAQATLNGKTDLTIESLYLSSYLTK